MISLACPATFSLRIWSRLYARRHTNEVEAAEIVGDNQIMWFGKDNVNMGSK